MENPYSKLGVTGMFQNDERCIQLLDVMQTLIERVLQDAYKAAANVKEVGPIAVRFTPHIAERFRYTLDLIPLWPASILEAEEERAKELDVHIQDCYTHMFNLYQQNFKIKSAMPRFRDFMHEIYTQLVQLPEIRNGIYFSLFGVNRKGVIADAIRGALRSSSKPEYVGQAPPLSPPKAAAASAVAAATHAPVLLPPPPFPVTMEEPAKATTTKPATRGSSTVATAFQKVIEVDLSQTLLAPPPSFRSKTPKTKVATAPTTANAKVAESPSLGHVTNKT